MLLLSITSSAQAKQGVPSWIATPEYKKLSSYVNKTLSSQKNIPASNEQKESYKQELGVYRQQAAQKARQLKRFIKTISLRKFNRIMNKKTIRLNKKIIKKVKLSTRKINRDLGKLKDTYNSTILSINSRYNPQLKKLTKRLNNLKNTYNESGPNKRLQLQDSIINAQDQIDSILLKKDRQIKKLDKQYKTRFNLLTERKMLIISRIKADRQRQLNQDKRLKARNIAVRLAALDLKLKMQIGKTISLYQTGVSYIASMPEVIPPPIVQ
jgi:hypothetical protein